MSTGISQSDSPSQYLRQSVLKNNLGHAPRFEPYKMHSFSSARNSTIIGAGKHFRTVNSLPSCLREEQRSQRFLTKEGTTSRKEFLNKEGFLPNLEKKPSVRYEEFQIGHAREGDMGSHAGKFRSVMKINETRKGIVITDQFITKIHYNDQNDKRKLSFFKKGTRKK